MQAFKAIGIAVLMAPLLQSCTSQNAAPRRAAADGDVVLNSGIAFRRRTDSNTANRPEVMGWAPAPAFPQTDLRIADRTVRSRVVATGPAPAVPGAVALTLNWRSTGSPSKVEVLRQTWTLGAVNSSEFFSNPQVTIANLEPMPDGYRTWVDPAPALNTQNCYRIKAGNGTFWSYSNPACVYTPDPDNPHAIGKVSLRLKVSTAASAATTDNVRARLNFGIPGGDGPAYTWLDAPETPFPIAGNENTFMLRIPDIGDLSDITMIRIEVPGGDGLCLNELELIADDTIAFRKTSPTQACGGGNPIQWAVHSSLTSGSVVEIPFQELRNSSLWRNFRPRIFSGTVTEGRPDGASFVGYTPSELRKFLDSRTGHDLKEDESDSGSSKQFRNGTNDRSKVTRIDDRTARVEQHLRIADTAGCTVDAHPVFTLNIRSRNATGAIVTNSNGPIESTTVETILLSSGIDSGGPLCLLSPFPAAWYAELKGKVEFERAFRAAGANEVDKPPAGMRLCFPADASGGEVGGTSLDRSFNNGGLAICLGEVY